MGKAVNKHSSTVVTSSLKERTQGDVIVGEVGEWVGNFSAVGVNDSFSSGPDKQARCKE